MKDDGGSSCVLPPEARRVKVVHLPKTIDNDYRGIDFTFGEGSLVLAGQTAEVGQSRIELPIAYDGPSISITLDPRFVIDFLKVLDAEKTFSLEVKDGDSAATCSTDDGYGYVIMPLARDR